MNSEPPESESKLEKIIKIALYRINCPSESKLLDYKMGLLTVEETVRLSQHLKICPHCPDALQNIKVKSQKQSSSNPKSNQQYPTRQIFTPTLIGNHAVVRGDNINLRGQGQSSRWYEIKKLGWDLTVNWTVEDKLQFTLQGLLIGPDELEMHQIQVELLGDFEIGLKKHRVVGTGIIDTDGSFSLKHIPPGLYGLRLFSPDWDIPIPDIALKLQDDRP